MNQTFIDMLVAIKDPAAIERAYNIMAAKRELLMANAKPKFQHSVMAPRPIEKTYSQVRLEQEEERPKGEPLLRLVRTSKKMRQDGFHDGMVFKFMENLSSGLVVKVCHVRSGKIAFLSPKLLETFYKKPWDGTSPTECNCAACRNFRLNNIKF
ncbi:hypothetical protein [Aeromonas phage JELG-KS1]|uniref:Uncharacterized protein n=1 Tax=Aeromonas phage JELG-KS1 TaxID=2951233 RepID=A0A9E7NN70_9CAUD|nr:hypothetical protein [Aeromonas phage JELG-KS1]